MIEFIWQNVAPPRAQYLLWFIARNRIKTGDFLLGLGLVEPHDANCALCQGEIEIISHLFIIYLFHGYYGASALIGGISQLPFIEIF